MSASRSAIPICYSFSPPRARSANWQRVQSQDTIHEGCRTARHSFLPTRMQLLVIRHGIAEEAETFAATGLNDSQRPLTKSGKRKMKEVAAGLREIVETVDVIGASPLLRAQQTAEIVAKAYGDVPVLTVQALSPGSEPSDLVEWVGQPRAVLRRGRGDRWTRAAPRHAGDLAHDGIAGFASRNEQRRRRPSRVLVSPSGR